MQIKIKFKDTAMCVVSGSGGKPRRGEEKLSEIGNLFVQHCCMGSG